MHTYIILEPDTDSKINDILFTYFSHIYFKRPLHDYFICQMYNVLRCIHAHTRIAHTRFAHTRIAHTRIAHTRIA